MNEKKIKGETEIGSRAANFCLSLILFVLAACSAASPTPTFPVLTATRTAALVVVSTTPSPTLSLQTPTSNPDFSPLPSPAFTPTVAPTSGGQGFLAEIEFSPWDHLLALAWSPDGSLLAAAAGSQVYIYRYPELTQAAVLPIGVRCSQLAFDSFTSPGSPILAAAVRDGSLQLWDPLAGSLLARWEAHRKSANSLAFSPDGNSLASVGNDAMVRVWDLTQFHAQQNLTFERKAEMIGGAVAVPAVRYSPDGLLLASVDLGVIRLRDPRTQRLVRTLRTETSLFDIAFSPDGRWLAAAEMDNQVQIWDPTSGELISAMTLPGKPAGTARPFVWVVSFNSPGSLLAAGSSTGRLIVWSVPGQEVALDVVAHTRGTSALAFHPDGNLLATGGLDGRLRIWSIR